MKKELLFVLLLLPQILMAQRVVILSVAQPPEFGFTAAKQDTTIVKGSSVILATDLVIYGGSGNYCYSWSPATSLSDPAILHPLATPADTTVYTLISTDKSGCSFSINYTVNVKKQLVNSNRIAGIKNLQAVMFPNPNAGNFKLKLTGIPSGKIELAVFDSAGKTIKRQFIRNFTGDHTETVHLQLESGIYVLQINSDTESLSSPFIIE